MKPDTGPRKLWVIEIKPVGRDWAEWERTYDEQEAFAKFERAKKEVCLCWVRLIEYLGEVIKQ